MTGVVRVSSSAEALLAPPHVKAARGLRGVGPLARFVRRKPLGAVGLAIMVVFVALALVAPSAEPHNPNIGVQGHRFAEPSRDFPFGTDQFSRDQLSRVLRGATISLEVGVFAVALGIGLGIIVGLVSGYLGGKVDYALQRVVDSFQALPGIIFALAIVTALGRSLPNVILALAISSWPGASRVVRSNVLAVKQLTYVDAARATGCSDARILWRHLLPNVVPICIILATAGLGSAILAEASLSFLGVGIRPPTPSWGTMINESAGLMQRYPYLVLFPGIAISLVVFGFNFLGDALRDYLDPRLRGGR